MWKVFISDPFLNCDKIHPIQQKKVKALLDNLDMTHVLKVEIFGSSITTSCHTGSDVDVYITLDQCVDHLITKYLPYEFDIWTNYTVDTRLYNEIKKHCVVVAERNHKRTGRRNN